MKKQIYNKCFLFKLEYKLNKLYIEFIHIRDGKYIRTGIRNPENNLNYSKYIVSKTQAKIILEKEEFKDFNLIKLKDFQQNINDILLLADII